MSEHFEIKKIYKGTISTVPFDLIKNAILGKSYSLSLVFSDKKLATQMHKEWKKKDDPANVLSFPLDTKSGEIFIYPKGNNVPYLFIHGCVHLKGFDHGKEMDLLEAKFCKKFGIKID